MDFVSMVGSSAQQRMIWRRSPRARPQGPPAPAQASSMAVLQPPLSPLALAPQAFESPADALGVPAAGAAASAPPQAVAPAAEQVRMGLKLLAMWRNYKKRKAAAAVIQNQFRAHRQRLYAMSNRVLLQRPGPSTSS